MKVLLINGSPKEHGNTFQALSEVVNTLNTEGLRQRLSASANRPFKAALPVSGAVGRANAHTTMTCITRYVELI